MAFLRKTGQPYIKMAHFGRKRYHFNDNMPIFDRKLSFSPIQGLDWKLKRSATRSFLGYFQQKFEFRRKKWPLLYSKDFIFV